MTGSPVPVTAARGPYAGLILTSSRCACGGEWLLFDMSRGWECERCDFETLRPASDRPLLSTSPAPKRNPGEWIGLGPICGGADNASLHCPSCGSYWFRTPYTGGDPAEWTRQCKCCGYSYKKRDAVRLVPAPPPNVPVPDAGPLAWCAGRGPT